MKKIYISIMLMLLFMLNSCGTVHLPPHRLETSSSDRLAQKRISQIVDLINERGDEWSELFSEDALSHVDDLSVGVNELYDFIEGEIISYEKDNSMGVTTNYRSGKEKREISSYYIVKTDDETYFFMITDYPIDEIDPTNEGLQSLVVVRYEGHRKIFDEDMKIIFDGDKKLTPYGVCVPIK